MRPLLNAPGVRASRWTVFWHHASLCETPQPRPDQKLPGHGTPHAYSLFKAPTTYRPPADCGLRSCRAPSGPGGFGGSGWARRQRPATAPPQGALDWSVLVSNPLIADLWGGDLSASGQAALGGAAGAGPAGAPQRTFHPTRSLGSMSSSSVPARSAGAQSFPRDCMRIRLEYQCWRPLHKANGN